MSFEVAPKETEIQANWDDAKMYCLFLNVDGKTGWRLPTRDELYLLYKNHNDFSKEWYWSSTKWDDHRARIQNFYYGTQYNFHKNNSYYVRAVRDIIKIDTIVLA
jgi:hypothetical protein